MKRQGKARLWLAFAAALALAGCEEGKSPIAKSGSGGGLGAALSPVSVERDVESPNVFNLKGDGLWDGRPSLGGVWVAHPSVNDPERVIIRNTKTGKSVIGALFRRERDNPGPSLQVSSDAAEALGMLAGQPAELSVVALRREESPVPADADVEASEAIAEVPTPEAGVQTAEGAPAVAATPVEGADVAAVETATAAAPATKKKTGGLFGFLRKKPAPAAADPAPAETASGPIEQAELAPITATAAAAIDRAEAANAPAPAPAPKPAAALKRAYIQIGIFSVEANAKRASDQMKAAGMTATVKTDQSQGKTYWRVIVGPAASEAERDALAARVKGVGYPDAYPVSN